MIKFKTLLIYIIFSNLTVYCYSSEPKRLVGYWHNWYGSAGTMLLTKIPEEYKQVNIAFALPDAADEAIMTFTPDPSIYPEEVDFINDIKTLQSAGRDVLISIGGGTGSFDLDNENDINLFVNSLSQIIEKYGFNGVDIDLEGQSLFIQDGDFDFRNPQTKTIANFIKAIKELYEKFGDEFILTLAPETAFVQGAYARYGGVWGAYLPLIHALRDKLEYIHVQHYNTGSMYGRDGKIYYPATADFHVAMADMLLSGFDVKSNDSTIFFEPLPEEKVMFGIPATNEAGGNFTVFSDVAKALKYLIDGTEFGGSYLIGKDVYFPKFAGLMTWSINWDMTQGYAFADYFSNFFDSLKITDVQNYSINPAISIKSNEEINIYPNPTIEGAKIDITITKNGIYEVKISNLNASFTKTLYSGPMSSGINSFNHAIDSEAGIYYVILSSGNRIIKTKAFVVE